jgi:hypothetical protein
LNVYIIVKATLDGDENRNLAAFSNESLAKNYLEKIEKETYFQYYIEVLKLNEKLELPEIKP